MPDVIEDQTIDMAEIDCWLELTLQERSGEDLGEAPQSPGTTMQT